MIVADFKVVPLGLSTSLGQEIKAIYDMLEEEGISYLPGPMSTAVEVDCLDDLLDVIELANQVLVERGAKRILTTINVDFRLDKEISIESKVASADPKLKDHIRKHKI